MNNEQRLTALLKHSRKSGKVIATDAAKKFGVTVQTIRRDLRALCDTGLLERVHGGAILPSGVRNIGYDDRRNLNREAKARIATRAAKLVPDNASLFLNIGTTTEAVARALLHHRELMVITNNLNVANILAQSETCDVTVTGGHLRRTDGGLVGELAANAIERFKVDIAIVGASAIDPDGDLLDFDPEEISVSRAILKAARKTLLVADSSKFARKAPVRVVNLSLIDGIITDRLPSERLANACLDWGTQIYSC